MTIVLLALLGLAASATIVDPLCADRGSTEFFAKPGSCADLYLCFNGALFEKTCPDSLWWNAEKGFCTYQQLSGCTDEEITVTMPDTEVTTPPTVTEPETKPVECIEMGITMYPHEVFCNQYYVCGGKDQKPAHGTCSVDYKFSEEAQQCIPAALSVCEDKVKVVTCPTDLAEGEIVHLANPNDCKSYFMCLNKEQHEFTCKGDLFWNAEVDSCDLEEKVSCSEG